MSGRTPNNLINQRNFGGHTFPRLAHVGDATGLELIRTLQERGIHEGIDIFMEYTVRHLLKEGDRATGCVAYTRVDGTSTPFLQSQLFLLLAVLLGAGLSAPAHGNTQVTVTPSPSGLAQNCGTWSLFNSTRLEWFGHHRFEAFS